jgi:hypothetical protein
VVRIHVGEPFFRNAARDASGRVFVVGGDHRLRKHVKGLAERGARGIAWIASSMRSQTGKRRGGAGSAVLRFFNAAKIRVANFCSLSAPIYPIENEPLQATKKIFNERHTVLNQAIAIRFSLPKMLRTLRRTLCASATRAGDFRSSHAQPIRCVSRRGGGKPRCRDRVYRNRP